MKWRYGAESKVVDDEARRKADEKANRRAEEAEARQTAEEAKRKAEEEAKRRAEEAEEARLKVEMAEEEARRKAEDEANRKAEEAEARHKAEVAKRKVEEEAKRMAEKEEEAQLKVQAFLTDARRVQAKEPRRVQGKKSQIQMPPFETKRPRCLPDGDDRFNKSKVERTYGCDSCGNLVSFSSWKRDTGSRAQGEFQGSYIDKSWAGKIPGEMLVRAYNEGLIDCSWQCTQFCNAPQTGVKERASRPEKWRKTNEGGAGSSGERYSKWR